MPLLFYSVAMIHLAIWASGSGSNAEKLWDYFHGHPELCISLLVCSRPEAPVVEKARQRGLRAIIFPSESCAPEMLLPEFRKLSIEGHVLAGYTRPVPSIIVQHWQGKILNLHPALLPKFGGRGMYGMHVHRAVLEAREPYSGISIHIVTEEYDSGPVIFQAEKKVPEGVDAETLALLIKHLEHRYYAPVVEAYFCGKLQEIRESSS